MIYFAFSLGPHIGEYRRGVNTIKNINYNKYLGLTSCNKNKHNFFNKRGYCTNNTPVKFKQKLIDTYHEGYRFNTYAYTSWIDIYKLFYNSRKKKVIPNNIENLLTPLTLAIWIMDDGTFKYSGVRIATNCFKKQEVELLVRALDSKFNIKSTLHKNNNNYQLYIKKESMFLLKKLVVPHMIPSMFYKLGL